MPDKNNKPVPPGTPKVDRVTGAVTMPRPEDVGQLDGWIPMESADETFNMGPDYCRPNQARRSGSELLKVDSKISNK